MVSALRQARETWAQVRGEHAGHGGHWPGQRHDRMLKDQLLRAAERQRAERAAQAQQRRAQAQQQRAERAAQAQQRRAQARRTSPSAEPESPDTDEHGSGT